MGRETVILFVDDNPHEHRFFKSGLEEVEQPVKVIFAWDGEEALALLGTMEKLPDFVFLDLNMSKLGGFETLARIKNDMGLRSVIVIIYTSSQLESEIRIAQDLGASWFINKPLLHFLPILLRFILDPGSHNRLPPEIFLRKLN